MRSYRDGELSQEQIEELAARIPDSEIEASLSEGQDHLPYILDDESGHSCVCAWSAFGGPMMHMHSDPVRRHATLEYLRRHGYPCFRSDEEVIAHAKANNWPLKPHPKTGTFLFEW